MELLIVLFSVVIWGIVFYVLWWGLNASGIGEPWHKVASLILILATVGVLIGLLTGKVAPFPFLLGLL